MLTQSCKMILFVSLYLLLTPIIAQNINDNSLNDRLFVTMLVNRKSSRSPSGLFIKIDNNGYEKECSVPEVFSSEWQIRVLSPKFVLAWLDDLNEDGKREGRFILIKVNNCKHQVIYSGVLSKKYEIFTSNNVSDEKFTLMMRGKEFCQGHDYCRLHFDPLFQKLQPFDLDFPSGKLEEISSAMSPNPNLFVVRHTDDTNTHRIRLYDLSSDETILNYNELLALPNYTSLVNNTPVPEYELVSSRLSVCWRKLRHDNMTFYCSKFTENGNMAYNQSIAYPDFAIPRGVKTMMPSRLIVNVIFECFESRDFSELPVKIAFVSNVIEHVGKMREGMDEFKWNKALDVISSRPPTDSLVYVQTEEEFIYEPIARL